MILGLLGFSFAIAAVASIVTHMDEKKSKIQERMNILNAIRREYKLKRNFYLRLRRTMKQDIQMNDGKKINLVEDLPPKEKNELAVIMHNKLLSKLKFFEKKNKQFTSFMGPLMKRIKMTKGEEIFKEGDPADSMYFLIAGKAGHVLNSKKYYSKPYVKIEKG